MGKHAGIWVACLALTGTLAVWAQADGYRISSLSDDLFNITHSSGETESGGDDGSGSSAGSSSSKGSSAGGSNGCASLSTPCTCPMC